MRTRFNLLGEFEMVVNDRVVPVGHARQRAVLTTLLVDVNRPVSADQLLARVWGEDGSPSVRSSLFSYLSRLRGVLAGSDVVIERRAGGYVLSADPLTIDLHLFAHLLRADDLRGALGLWRGEALHGLDSPWFAEVRARLDDERLAAQLTLHDRLLQQGRHHELLADLTAMTTARPLDERLAGQLMLALYRSGRQADALEHYRRVHRLLADELGARPGVPLRQLHQRILEADPSLEPGRQDVPRQLPAAPRLFTGRDRELDALTSCYDLPRTNDGAAVLAPTTTAPTPPVSTKYGPGWVPDNFVELTTVVISAIGGTGGVGKTWLALRWAHEHLDRFPDGQLYADLRGFDPAGRTASTAAVLRGFLDALGATDVPASVDAQAALYRSLLATRRMLVVLDNAADSAQVEPLLPGGATCAVLVTSRRRLVKLVVAHGAHVLDLDVLDERDARELFARRLPAARLDAEPDAVTEVLRWCGGLPLALSIAAGRAALEPRLSLAALARELRDEAARLDALDDTELSLRSVLATSCRALPADALALFRLLGLTPDAEISAAAVAALAGVPDAGPLLDVLENAHLVAQPKPGRYRMHDLVRLYARELGAADEERALGRLVDHYLLTGHRGERLLYPLRPDIELLPSEVAPEELADEAAALAWFGDEQPSVLAALRAAEARGWHEQVWRMAWALTTYHFRRALHHDQVEACEAELRATHALGDARLEARAHRRVADAHARLGDHETALHHLKNALDLSAQIGDVVGQAHGNFVLGAAWEQREDFAQALAHAEEALRLYETLDNTVWLAQGHSAVGWFSARTGDHDRARTHCSVAVDLYRSAGHLDGEAATLDSLGLVAHESGEHREALEHYGRARALYREIGGRYVEVDVLSRLGETHVALGDPGAARQAWQEAVEIYESQERLGKAEEIRARLLSL